MTTNDESLESITNTENTSKKEKIKDVLSCYVRNHVGLGTEIDLTSQGNNRPDFKLRYENTTHFIDGLITMVAGTTYAIANLSSSTDKGWEVAAGVGIGFGLGWAGSMIEVNGAHYIKKGIQKIRDNYKRK